MNWLVISSLLLGVAGVNTLPTTPPTTTFLTTTAECRWQDIKMEQCRAYTCKNGRWQGFQFTATTTCCYTHPNHPKCIMFYPGRLESSTFYFLNLGVNTLPTTPPTPTILTTTAECKWQDNKVERCRVYTCENGRWLGFEFTATKTCCYTQPDHPKCIMFYPELFGTSTPPTTTFPTTTTECTDGGKVEHCMSYLCSNGRYQPFEFVASHFCCQTKPFHPRCIMMFPGRSGTAPP